MAPSSEPAPVSRTPAQVLADFTPAASIESHRVALRALVNGSKEPLLWMQGVAPEAQRRAVPACLDAAITELARQFNVSIYACAAWKGGHDTMASTQVLQLVDQDQERLLDTESARHHFVDFVCRNAGMPLVLEPDRAYPVTYPDVSMDGRPALPPEHPIWKQERANLIEFSEWQGGHEGPNWYLIQNDVNSKKYEMVDKARLPKAHIPFVVPDEWNENMTRIWSKHLRSSTDAFGCVKKSHIDHAFQYRALLNEDENPWRYDTVFRECAWPDCKLEYGMAALMYAQRVNQERQADSGAPATCTQELYPEGAMSLVREAAKHVPALEHLWPMLKQYEARSPPQAPVPSGAGLAAWPRPARHIKRDLNKMDENYIHYDYPGDFIELEHKDWETWNPSKLYRWILSNPFLDEASSLQMAGPHGIFVACLSVLQYSLNYAKVMPKDEAESEKLLAQGRASYGPRDLHFLGRCAEKLADFVTSSLNLLPPSASQIESDKAERRAAWQPKQWCHVAFDGTTTVLAPQFLDPGHQPYHNVFDCAIEEHWTTIKSEDQTTLTENMTTDLDISEEQSDLSQLIDQHVRVTPKSIIQRRNQPIVKPELQRDHGDRKAPILPLELVQNPAASRGGPAGQGKQHGPSS
ncbi:hypothetical protein FS749_005686 [Ceratobasidium sp. UAMH 11750]|nr:hypothetical protein FS749_005686 [Ceratobasidium sp. UAMH 11750]